MASLAYALRLRPPAMADDCAIRLIVRFRGAGWRYPFTLGDSIEVWRHQDCLGEIPAVLVTHVLTHYVQGAVLTRRVQAALGDPPPEAPAPPPATPAAAPPESPRLRGLRNRRLRGRGPA